jgi:hypothetical protein
MEKTLRLSALAIVVLSSIALALSSGRIVGSTFALFNGETQNAASTFAGGWIGAPTGATAVASGYDMSLAWTPGAHGPITGQTLNCVDNNTNSNCTGAAYAFLISGPAATAAYTDPSRGSASSNGHWYCYQLVSTTTPSLWTASTALPAVQLGLVTSGISITNVATNNSIRAGDTITLTFNQQTDLAASGTTKVCAINSGSNDRVIIGDTAGGTSCGVNDGYTVGRITGVTIGGNQVYRNSTFTTTSSAPYTMTITLVGSGTATYSGTATFTPSSSILSAVTTHQATMCTTAAAICQPTTTTHF